MPTEEHGIIVLRLGRVMVEVRHRLPEDDHNAHLPDIAFRSDTSTPIMKKGSLPVMADLREKADYYLAHGLAGLP